MLLNTFQFSGVSLVGNDLYVALWGGAGSQSLLAYTKRTPYRYYQHGAHSGSGGLVLAKITGVAANQSVRLYAGGRGRVNANEDVVGSGRFRLSSRGHRAYSSGSGAASALSIVAANDTESWLLIAPSGAGYGGARFSSKQTFAGNHRNGGHGRFDGQSLGRATVAHATRPTGTGADSTYNPWNKDGQSNEVFSNATPGGEPGHTPLNSEFGYPLLGRYGEGYSSPKFGSRGGGGAPDGADGAYRKENEIAQGGTGGIGYVAGFGSGTYAQETLGSGSFGDISVEFVAFDGRENIVGDPSSQQQFDRVAALRAASSDAGALVTEVTNALGWQTSPASGKANWPPQMQDHGNALSIEALDLSSATYFDTHTQGSKTCVPYWPGQTGSPYKNNATVMESGYITASLSIPGSIASNYASYWSNPGAAMLRVGQDGVCVGFNGVDDTGAEATVSSEGQSQIGSGGTETDGAQWQPYNGANSSQSLPPASNLFNHSASIAPSTSTASWSDLLSEHFSLSTNTVTHSATDAVRGFSLQHAGGTTSDILLQTRDNDAGLYELDMADAARAWVAGSETSGIPSSSSARNRLAISPVSDTLVIGDTAGPQIIDREVDPPVVYSRDNTGTVIGTTHRGLTIDPFNYAYLADDAGNLDVFDLDDLANNAPITLALPNAFNRTTNTNRLGGIAYDHQLDLLWYSYDSRVSWLRIDRNADDEPTGFSDFYLNDTGTYYLDRTLGTYDGDDIHWVSPNLLLQTDGSNARLLDVSSIAPNFNGVLRTLSGTQGQGDFVFSIWGGGGGGGGKGDSSTATTEDGGAGGSGAFVEVRVTTPAMTGQDITFGVHVGEKGGGGQGTTAGGSGGGGGGASVLYVKVGSTSVPIAFAAGGGGGGGAGETAAADGGYGGSAAGVTPSTGVGLQAQDGLGPNNSQAGDGGGGGAGTSAGVKASSANAGATPPTKSTSTSGQTGGEGDNANASNTGSQNNGGQSVLSALGGSGGNSNGSEGGGGGGGGGFFAGAGGEHASGGNESGGGGGGGSSHVAIGDHTIGGITITVVCLRSEGGTLQTGAPSAVAQSAGSTQHWSTSNTYGAGGDGAPETLSNARNGSAGSDGAILMGFYPKSTANQTRASHDNTLSVYEEPARDV